MKEIGQLTSVTYVHNGRTYVHSFEKATRTRPSKADETSTRQPSTLEGRRLGAGWHEPEDRDYPDPPHFIDPDAT